MLPSWVWVSACSAFGADHHYQLWCGGYLWLSCLPLYRHFYLLQISNQLWLSGTCLCSSSNSNAIHLLQWTSLQDYDNSAFSNVTPYKFPPQVFLQLHSWKQYPFIPAPPPCAITTSAHHLSTLRMTLFNSLLLPTSASRTNKTKTPQDSNKSLILSEFITDNELDLLCLTETWHKPMECFAHNQTTPTGYSYPDNPLSDSQGGGLPETKPNLSKSEAFETSPSLLHHLLNTWLSDSLVYNHSQLPKPLHPSSLISLTSLLSCPASHHIFSSSMISTSTSTPPNQNSQLTSWMF